MSLPLRDLSTMAEAIALSSPSGRMSKRSRLAADRRLSLALFGPEGLQGPIVTQPSEREYLLRKAGEFRDFAARGLSPRKYNREADKLEAQAREL